MHWAKIQEFLLPCDPERDAGFRQEVERLGVRGLYIIGAVEIGMPLINLAVNYLFQSERFLQMPLWTPLTFVGLGVLALALARVERLRPHARALALLFGFVTAAYVVCLSLFLLPDMPEGKHLVVVNIVLVLLVGVAAVPARPVHMFVLGTAIFGFYVALSALALGWDGLAETSQQNHALQLIPVAVLLCTALAGTNYQRTYSTYWAHQQALEGQSQLLLAENAATMGRLAAALGHELNTPVGVLKSTIDSMELLEARRSSFPEEKRRQLERTEADLRRAARESADRIHEIVGRMQRFANLDRAQVMPVDLNALLRDVAALLRPGTPEKVDIETDFHPVPKLTVRPQQISAVFSNLLHNAVGDASPEGRVRLVTRHIDSRVEIEVSDSGQGLSEEDLIRVFEPGFRVKDGRMAAGNWSLFTTRQIVREHGGEIRIGSSAGQGTTVCVALPVSSLARAANSSAQVS